MSFFISSGPSLPVSTASGGDLTALHGPVHIGQNLRRPVQRLPPVCRFIIGRGFHFQEPFAGIVRDAHQNDVAVRETRCAVSMRPGPERPRSCRGERPPIIAGLEGADYDGWEGIAGREPGRGNRRGAGSRDASQSADR